MLIVYVGHRKLTHTKEQFREKEKLDQQLIQSMGRVIQNQDRSLEQYREIFNED